MIKTNKKHLSLNFFTGGYNQKFDSFVRSKGLSTENQEFVDFLLWDLCKEILESNNLKIHIETGNIYYKNEDSNESIFEFIKNNKILLKEWLIMIYLLKVILNITSNGL